ncbi:DUF4339 domain-containing protein [Colwellia sp. E2M01]|uniref:DUF4339 domain-containing protein n=1 Tax=Colwellia sp. E2M01 TaxID=2841561 RepID=UPI001C0992F9|nr:DUF4339 domain-containing protein [Colwellia sp. E2M01]MBU2870437.1 DUF4339 domain-containing protein [Colwellia sp. E2M01]
MNKWFFSDNGEITGPLELNAVKGYLAEHTGAYGWNPSFTQWKPISCIVEFYELLPAITPTPSIPDVISQKFLAKQERISAKLAKTKEEIAHSQNCLDKFDHQIMDYKDLTHNLNDDVKGAIDNIERKYNSLRRKLLQVREAVSIAKGELDIVVDDFTKKIGTNDIVMPSCIKQSIIHSDHNQSKNIIPITARQPKEKLATPLPPVENPPVNNEPEPKYEPQQMYRGAPVIKNDRVVKINKKESIAQKPTTTNNGNETKESLYSMHGMMKSVFKGDSRFVD